MVIQLSTRALRKCKLRCSSLIHYYNLRQREDFLIFEFRVVIDLPLGGRELILH